MRQDHDKAYPMQAAAYTYLTDADWTQRINELARIAGGCELCPRRCRVNRFEGERGFCAAPGRARRLEHLPPPRRGAASFRHRRLGHGVFHPLHPQVRLLPELPDLPRTGGPAVHGGGAGAEDAAPPGPGLPQHQPGHAHPFSALDPAITENRGRWRPAPADRLQLRRLRARGDR